jgi:Protein of unknown function (DUF1573)
MKRVYILTVLGLIFLSSCKEDVASKIKQDNLVQAKQRDAKIATEIPVMTFDKREFDFGTINEGDIVETVFKFENTGKTDLLITNAYSSCGCTIPEWPKQPIKPGGKAIIKVKFNSRGKKNKQSKTITLNTNTKSGRELLVIKAQVTPDKKINLKK